MELARQDHGILRQYFTHPDTQAQTAHIVANAHNALMRSGASGVRQEITIAGVKSIHMTVR